jgi:uncharacterized Rossmann fold enzyme
MSKIDKSLFTKSEWQEIKETRRKEKIKDRSLKTPNKTAPIIDQRNSDTAFVIGNGTSRKNIDLKKLKTFGTVYGCNALYREFVPDYLVAVDVKMVLEIANTGYQHNNAVYTNYNKSYQKIDDLNYFQPSKGWSSGPTALWLASQHNFKKIFILGFDFKGLEDGKKFNNVYADTKNYKRSKDAATFYGNWLRQTKTVITENKRTNFFRVITSDNFFPDELNNFHNFRNLYKEDLEKIFNLQ